MNEEYADLINPHKAAVDQAIAQAKETGRGSVPVENGEAYAYPHPGGGIAWGVNGGAQGFNIARGVKK